MSPFPPAATLLSGQEGGKIFAQFVHQHRNDPTDRDALAFLEQAAGQDAPVERLELHGGFIGLHFGDDFAWLDLIPHLFLPLDQDSFDHRVGESGHLHQSRHESDSDY
jgi:hypothetical protein